jgi:hypothetical protein
MSRLIRVAAKRVCVGLWDQALEAKVQRIRNASGKQLNTERITMLAYRPIQTAMTAYMRIVWPLRSSTFSPGTPALIPFVANAKAVFAEPNSKEKPYCDANTRTMKDRGRTKAGRSPSLLRMVGFGIDFTILLQSGSWKPETETWETCTGVPRNAN